MRRVVKYILVAMAVLLCLAIALFEYSVYRDQKNFSEAKNDCEGGCIQDSGGFPSAARFARLIQITIHDLKARA